MENLDPELSHIYFLSCNIQHQLHLKCGNLFLTSSEETMKTGIFNCPYCRASSKCIDIFAHINTDIEMMPETFFQYWMKKNIEKETEYMDFEHGITHLLCSEKCDDFLFCPGGSGIRIMFKSFLDGPLYEPELMQSVTTAQSFSRRNDSTSAEKE